MSDLAKIIEADQQPLGKRLRSRRKALKLTLQEVADQAELSVGFISQIERGIAVPSLVSLVAVCRVLDVDVGTFFQKSQPQGPITRRDNRPLYGLGSLTGKDVTYERLSAAFPGNILRSTLIHEPPGFRSEPTSHEGEEIYYIVRGSLTLELEGEITILNEGDTAHFPSSQTHVIWNHTGDTTIVFHTCTMDVFGDENQGTGSENVLAVTRAVNRRGAPK
ncbi:MULTISPECIES: helix-turn-helix domain-containing protein [Brucella/Ochrobactrum group]|uniref:Helix-turn-helix domain-containing protein n=2 Tax=Bacteria TaxID=2 RepID=A0A643EVQ1_9HYPH|nr:XRE family transcriptional regulator [Brucella pituitosa]KAB0567267.1 helix-turn-helix domain-containing protein [Brucella pituitosa]